MTLLRALNLEKHKLIPVRFAPWSLNVSFYKIKCFTQSVEFKKEKN